MSNEFVVQDGESPETMKDMERWRLNLQIKAAWAERKELADDKECPDEVIAEFDHKLGQLLAAQEVLLGGVAKPARGILRGSYQPPLTRQPSPNPLKPWLGEQIAAVVLFKTTGRRDYAPALANRRERRQWARVNPFRVKKNRLSNKAPRPLPEERWWL